MSTSCRKSARRRPIRWAASIFSMFGRVPVRGELLRHAAGVEFEILEADPRRVKRVKIRPPEPDEPAPAEAVSSEKPV